MAQRRSAVLSAVLTTTLATTLTTVLAAAVTVASAVPAAGLPAAGSGALVKTADASNSTTGFRFVDIPARDGVVLKANVIAPTASGHHPAIVFVNSWGLNDAEYLIQASAFARRGYVVLSYTTRGFWGSGGQIDTGGPKDVSDVSAVIDWLLANTAADPAHIGTGGTSYGSGICLLASAFDPRIKAIAAMSTWTDLVYSLYGNDTRRPQAVMLLKIVAQLFGKPSPELTSMIDAYFVNENLDPIKQWGRVRSPATYIDAINRNHPAIMMANSYGDSLFPPNQLIDFYARLTGPKRLEFAPGDHLIVEGTGLLGLPNHVWDSTSRWFDRYLAGNQNGIDTEPPVVLRRINSDAVESYPDWAHVTSSTQRLYLGDTRWWDATGPLTPTAVTSGWSGTITTGTDTTANAGVAVLTNTLTALTGIPPTDWLPSIVRANASVWISDWMNGGATIRGCPKLHLAITGARPTGTLIAYLYDTDALGTGRLITHAPITWLASTNVLNVDLPATAYDIPAGHRLALVVDSVDPLYLGANQNGAKVTFTASSWLDVPLR
jgi:predicted acyl esterase